MSRPQPCFLRSHEKPVFASELGVTADTTILGKSSATAYEYMVDFFVPTL